MPDHRTEPKVRCSSLPSSQRALGPSPHSHTTPLPPPPPSSRPARNAELHIVRSPAVPLHPPATPGSAFRPTELPRCPARTTQEREATCSSSRPVLELPASSSPSRPLRRVQAHHNLSQSGTVWPTASRPSLAPTAAVWWAESTASLPDPNTNRGL
jgi:hypothetical protein